MNLTPLVRTFFSRRVAAIDSYADRAEQLQRTVLARLVRSAARTAWGERHSYDVLGCSEDIAARVSYMETYNASEGFFGLQTDPGDRAMTLMLDYDVFYEFIPLEEVGTAHPTVLPLWEVEANRHYALVISTSCGLWRYQIGDTVRFTQTFPHKFVISGRTKSFINAFGEELMVDNAEQGLKAACKATGAEVREYTAAPVFMDSAGKCRHQWLIEFAQAPADLRLFAHTLDEALRAINSDYDAKRYKDITLQQLEIVVARPGLFDDWLRSRGKLGGQHKVPRLSNHRNLIEEILAMNA